MSVQVKGSGTIGGLDEGLVVSGIVTSSTQINVGSNIKLGNAGVVTATSFVGNFTGTSSGNAVLTGSTNNELVTVTGANAITGESGLTWTGSVFQLTSSGGNQFPFNVRNDFTPNSQRCDYGYFANSTSNNALRLGSINSNGGVTIQSTRMNDSAQKHNLLLNPDGGYVWINKATSSDYGRFEVKGPTADDILTGDIRTKTIATFSGASPGTTAAGKGAGIVIKPITDRGCHYFFGVANSSANQEAQGTFVIRSGHLASSSAERLRIASDGKITPTEGVIIPDNKQLSIGDDADLYIKYSAAHGNNFIVSSNGDIEHHMSSSEKIIKGFQNSGNPYVGLYYNGGTRFITTNEGATFSTGSSSCVVRLTSNNSSEHILQAYNNDLNSFSNPKSLAYYFQTAYDLYKMGNSEVPLEVLFNKYEELTERFESLRIDIAKNIDIILKKEESGVALSSKEERNKRIYDTNSNAVGAYLQLIDQRIAKEATCDILIPLYSKSFEANKDNSLWIKRAAGRLDGKECSDDPLFVTLVEQLHSLEPSADSAYYLGILNDKSGNSDQALKYYQESVTLESDNYKKANILYRIAVKFKNSGRKTSSRNYAERALSFQPSMGKAYILSLIHI